MLLSAVYKNAVQTKKFIFSSCAIAISNTEFLTPLILYCNTRLFLRSIVGYTSIRSYNENYLVFVV